MKKLLMMALAVAMGTASSMAAPTDISGMDNALYVKDASVTKGKTATLTLELKNALTNVQSIGAYITLPAGVTVTNATLTDRSNPAVTKTGAESNYVQTNVVDGVTRLALLGCSGEAFSGNEGTIVTLEVNVADTVEAGSYDINVSNIELCTLDSKATVLEGTIATTLTVGAGGVKGDVNGDKVVDVADAVSVYSIIAEEGYDAKADVNGDKVVDVADAVSIYDIMATQD